MPKKKGIPAGAQHTSFSQHVEHMFVSGENR